MQDNTMDSDSPSQAPTEEPQITAREKMLQARGQEVAMDYFLFSCLERERLERSQAAKTPATEKIIWPPLANLAADTPDRSAIDGSDLGSLMSELIAWYGKSHPALTETKPLDHEQLNEIVAPFVSLSRDLADLYRTKAGGDLPAFGRNSANIDFYSDVQRQFESTFESYAKYFVRYFQWSHAEELKEDFEPGSRPPVGRYAPPPLPRSGSKFPDRGVSRGGGGGRREEGGDRLPKSRFERPGDTRREAAREGGSAEGRTKDRPRNARPKRDRDENRGGNRGSEGQRPRPGRESDETTRKMTEEALADVDRALNELRSQPDLAEVALKPTNSFYRRIQHQKIVDEGFHSFSVGEGAERAVKVGRRES